jgi:hypothetical protein
MEAVFLYKYTERGSTTGKPKSSRQTVITEAITFSKLSTALGDFGRNTGDAEILIICGRSGDSQPSVKDNSNKTKSPVVVILELKGSKFLYSVITING